MCVHTHTLTYTSSSSSCLTASIDLPDTPLLPISIVYHSREVFQATSCIDTELLYIGSSWSSNFYSPMCRSPQKYIAYEFILISPAASHMSGLSNFDSFCYEWLVVVQLLFCRVLPPGLVQYNSQHSCVIAIKLFLHAFS